MIMYDYVNVNVNVCYIVYVNKHVCFTLFYCFSVLLLLYYCCSSNIRPWDIPEIRLRREHPESAAP